MLCGLHTGHARDITICVYRSKLPGTRYMGFLETKEMLFQAVFFLGAMKVSGILISTKSLFCFRSI